MNARYEALFFDVGHTLLECTNPTEVGWANALAGMGGPSAEALSAAFNRWFGLTMPLTAEVANDDP